MLTVAALEQSNVGTQLLKRIAGFTGFLHDNGYGVSAAVAVVVQKIPGVAETLDWTAALLRSGITVINEEGAERIIDTLSALIKTRDDRTGFTPDVVARIAATC